MGDNSKIEWTDASWNPIVGCSIVSPGCTNCYAMKVAGARLDGNPKAPHYGGTTRKSKAGPVWSGELALAPEHILTAPLRWSKPRRIFVNSMGDLFHEDCPDEWIDRVFAVMTLCPRHTFQVLTKRSERMRDYFANRYGGSVLPSGGPYIERELQIDTQTLNLLRTPLGRKREEETGRWQCRLPLPNVWLGVSTEDQQRADERIPDLLETPATVRFVSAEPLLGPLDLEPRFGTMMSRVGDITIYEDGSHTFEDTEIPRILRGLDWVIVGGESGPNARPMHPDWARSLRDQCAVAGVPYFFKQWGEWTSAAASGHGAQFAVIMSDDEMLQGKRELDRPDEDGWILKRVGKKLAGRLLDGREHNDMPEA
jgi:protein gp37